MSYQSPIEIIQTQMQSQIEGDIYKAVMKVGVNVDKNELLKALQYDRDQYQKGYTDRDSEIVRCKECKYAHMAGNMCKFCDLYKDDDGFLIELYVGADWFCAGGERRRSG